MNFQITGLNFDVTQPIKEYIDNKLVKIYRHEDKILSTTVTLSVEKINAKAEVDLHLPGKKIHIESIHTDMYAAIDSLMDKLDRSINKHKGKANNIRSNNELLAL